MSARPAFYAREGDLLSPLKPLTGPWDRRLQSGGGMAGLMAHVIEQTLQPGPMTLCRFSLDILKATPFGPIATRRTVLREGSRLQLIQAEIVAGGAVTVRATGLRVREHETPATASPAPPPPPHTAPERAMRKGGPLSEVLTSRLLAGGLETPGPGASWSRFDADMIFGEPVTPFVAAVMAADFGSGLSSVLDWRAHHFANVDLSLHLTRAPRDAWIRVDAETETAGNGVAIVTMTLSDPDGAFGRAHQTLFVTPVARAASPYAPRADGDTSQG